jgi:hypothetical protein
VNRISPFVAYSLNHELMLKSVIFAALFVLFSFAPAETANDATFNDLELANKGVVCSGRCEPIITVVPAAAAAPRRAPSGR